jgi:aminoglycoside 6-adenylyltransferase
MATAFLDQLLDNFTAWLKDVDDCRALILFGSTARDEGDQYSDHDIQVVATDREDEQYINWMRDYTPFWVLVREPNVKSPLWIVMYRGGHKVHLSVISVDDLQAAIDSDEIDTDYRRGYKILIDKDNHAVQLPKPQPLQHTPPTQDEFTKCIQNLFYGLCLMAKYLRRDDLYTLQMNSGIFLRFLLPLIEWHSRGNNPNLDTWHRGEHMREWVEPHIWQGLHDTAARFDAGDGWRALFAMADFIETLTQEAAKRYGYTYPQATFAEVKAYLNKVYEQNN